MEMKYPRLLLLFMVCSVLVLLTASNFVSPVRAEHANTVLIQESPTPPLEDSSEVGSTDGILLMGAVIVLIVTIPLFIKRKK